MKKEIILLHGALGSSEQFEKLSNALSDNFRVYSFDLPGHGKSGDSFEIFSIEGFSNSLENFIENNSLNKPNIFGYSMGGYVALYLEAIRPGTFERIMTLATKYFWSPEISHRETKNLNPAVVETKVPDFARELEFRHTATGWKNVLLKTSEMMTSLGNDPLLHKKLLENVSCCCLIGVGDKDRMVSTEETVELYRSLKNAELLVIPDTLHPIEKINLERLKFEIIRFFLSLGKV